MTISSHHPIGFLVAVAVTCMLHNTSLSQTKSLDELGPVGEVHKVQGGFTFTEGPASHADGSIYFTDIPTARIHRLAPDGTLSVLQESSGHAVLAAAPGPADGHAPPETAAAFIAAFAASRPAASAFVNR